MSVYVITDGEFYKIGWTEIAVERRLTELQTGNPKQLSLVLTLNGGRQLEQSFHAMFASKRVVGEWFRLLQSDIEVLKCWECPTCGAKRLPVETQPQRLPASLSLQEQRPRPSVGLAGSGRSIVQRLHAESIAARSAEQLKKLDFDRRYNQFIDAWDRIFPMGVHCEDFVQELAQCDNEDRANAIVSFIGQQNLSFPELGNRLATIMRYAEFPRLPRLVSWQLLSSKEHASRMRFPGLTNRHGKWFVMWFHHDSHIDAWDANQRHASSSKEQT